MRPAASRRPSRPASGAPRRPSRRGTRAAWRCRGSGWPPGPRRGTRPCPRPRRAPRSRRASVTRVREGAKRTLTPSTKRSGTTLRAVPPAAVVTVSVSWKTRPSTVDGGRLALGGAREERRRARGSRSRPPTAARRDRCGRVNVDVRVDAADAARVHVARRSARRRTRTTGVPIRRDVAQHRGEAVQVREALLAVVEDADHRAVACGGVLEHREDRRVAALHVGRAAADDAQAVAMRPVIRPGRHRVEVADERDALSDRARPCERPPRCRGARPRRPEARGSAPPRAPRAPPRRP